MHCSLRQLQYFDTVPSKLTGWSFRKMHWLFEKRRSIHRPGPQESTSSYWLIPTQWWSDFLLPNCFLVCSPKDRFEKRKLEFFSGKHAFIVGSMQ